MAKDKSTEPTKQKLGLRAKFIVIFGSFAMIAMFHTGFMFFIVAMLPAIIAHYLDQTRSRFRFNTVTACNLSGVMPFMHHMVQQGRSNSVVTEMMSDISNWLIIYAAALFGWFLVYITPIISSIIIKTFHEGQIARYESLQKRLIDDWGPEVANIFSNDKKEEAL